MSLRKKVTSGENHVFATLLADVVGRHINENNTRSTAPDFHITNSTVTVESRDDGRQVVLRAECVGNPCIFVMRLNFRRSQTWICRIYVDAVYTHERPYHGGHIWDGIGKRNKQGAVVLDHLVERK